MSTKPAYDSTKIGPQTWWNGSLIETKDAQIHLSAHSLHYGMAVFEGIRAYELANKKIGIFRCADHMRRFNESCRIGGLPENYSVDELVKACREVVQASGFGACYLRPIGFLNAGPLGVAFDKKTHPFTVAIMGMNWGRYLGHEAFDQGAKVKTSSYTRLHPNISMTKAKICGQYVNSVLAKVEAKQMGFDEALLLDPEGYVSEASGENIFVVKGNTITTPSVESVLSGITRDTVSHILKDMKIECRERRLSRDELYAADEIFFCGTAAEISPVTEIDMRKIGLGKPGEITKEISRRFFDIVQGHNSRYESWINLV